MKPTRLLLLVLLLPCLLFAGNPMSDADHAFASQQYWNAMQLYKKAVAQKSTSKTSKARAYYQIGECYRKTGDWNAATVYYHKAISAKYPDDKAWLYLAQSQQMAGQYDQAIASFQEYQKRVPSDPSAQLGIEACKRATEWLASPSCYLVNNEAQLNTKFNDFCPMWSDRKHSSLVITSKRPGQTGSNLDPVSGNLFSDMFEARVDNKGKWSTPATVQGDVNLPASNDGASCITKNGNHMFFTRCEQKKKQFVTCKIYYAEKKGNTWGAPVLVDFGLDAATLDSFNFRHPAVSMNEEVMVFSSDMTGSKGGEHSDLWMSTFDKKTKKWSKPVNMGTTINSDGREGFPYIADDGTLYYSSDGMAGLGGLDIYRAPKMGNEWKWGAPENMKCPINSPADDFGIVYDHLQNKGFFTSNREGTKGSDDIWSFKKIQMFISGTVTDCANNVAVANAIVSMVCSDGSTEKVRTDAAGKYKFRLKEDVSYVINVTSDATTASSKGKAYYDLDEEQKGKFTTLGRNACDDLAMDFCLKLPPPPDVDVAFPAVLYGLDSAKLRPESKDSLDYLYNLLVKHPHMVIEIDAHTDCRATSKHNLDLSQRRAQACVDYLISKGIAPERLKAKGWGEERPLKLPSGVVLSEKYINSRPAKEREALHQQNRRTVFRVLSNDYVDPKAPKEEIPTEEIRVKSGYYDHSGEAESGDGEGEDAPAPKQD